MPAVYSIEHTQEHGKVADLVTRSWQHDYMSTQCQRSDPPPHQNPMTQCLCTLIPLELCQWDIVDLPLLADLQLSHKTTRDHCHW